MWSRRKRARRAAAIALFGLLFTPPVTLAATTTKPASGDVVKIEWFLRGEGDAYFPTVGMRQTYLHCAAAKTAVYCETKVYEPSSRIVFCSEGTFTLVGKLPAGQFSAPVKCGKRRLVPGA